MTRQTLSRSRFVSGQAGKPWRADHGELAAAPEGGDNGVSGLWSVLAIWRRGQRETSSRDKGPEVKKLPEMEGAWLWLSCWS